MTSTTAPPPPSAPHPGIPADFNKAADFWFYEIGISVIPAKTKIKKTFTQWSQYQNAPVTEEQFNEWKETNAFADGIAVVPGRVWRGPQKGKFFTFLDLDNQKVIDEFRLSINGAPTLEQIARRFIVEQHKDNPSKAHIYFYSEIPFVKRGSDESNPKFKPEEQPAFEVKGLGSHGIAYCTPSVHKDGHPYEIIGTAEPVCLNKSQAQDMMQRLDSICKKYGLHYLENDDGSGKTNIPIESLYEEEFRIHEGNNRHVELLRFMESVVKKNAKKLHLPVHIIKELCKIWNQRCCVPPLDDKEFERQWKDATKFIDRKVSEEEKKQDDDEDDEDASAARAVKALKLAKRECVELFLNESGRPFAAMKMPDGHVEVHPMDESKFKNWISNIYYTEYDKLLSDEDLKKIVRILLAQAEHDSSIQRYRIDIRVRGYNSREEEKEEAVGNVGDVGIFSELKEDFDTIYYDLTNKKWEAIKITAEGWSIDKKPPHRLFRRYGGELPQVYPDRNYEPTVLSEYMTLLNLHPEYKDTQELLGKVRLVTDLWPNTTPKPIIIIPSAQGTGKTTKFELDKDLIDPNAILTMSFPKDDNQLKQALAHNYISYFDNLSYISDEQSNTLCRSVTGAGDFKRALYENDTDVIYNYRRIVGLNGITNVATRSDLMERGLIILLGDIPRDQRELLRKIRRKYLALKPKVLGFLLDVVSQIMAERQKWKGKDEDYFGLKDVIDANGGLPRMADWAILGEQAAAIIARKEGKPYEQGTFLKAFDENLKILNVEAIKASLVAEALIAFMTNRQVVDSRPTWEGSPTMLLAELNNYLLYNGDCIKINTNTKAWPQNPALLGKEIAGIAPNLKEMGIVIEFSRTETNVRYKIDILPTCPTLPTGGDKK